MFYDNVFLFVELSTLCINSVTVGMHINLSATVLSLQIPGSYATLNKIYVEIDRAIKQFLILPFLEYVVKSHFILNIYIYIFLYLRGCFHFISFLDLWFQFLWYFSFDHRLNNGAILYNTCCTIYFSWVMQMFFFSYFTKR